MTLESAVDTEFSVHYSGESDRFTLENSKKIASLDVARLNLGSEEDFILFHNHRPGMVLSATHIGINQFAIDTLARVVFDHTYPLACESLRASTTIYTVSERSGTIVIPWSNERRLGRIALHAQAANARQAVTEMHQRLIHAGAYERR